MHDMRPIIRSVPTASPPFSEPIHTWNIWYMSFAMPDSESINPMNINIGSVSIGYQLNSFIAALKPSALLPSPHRKSAAVTPTKPIAAKTRCPVSIRSIRVENINTGDKLIFIPFFPPLYKGPCRTPLWLVKTSMPCRLSLLS